MKRSELNTISERLRGFAPGMGATADEITEAWSECGPSWMWSYRWSHSVTVQSDETIHHAVSRLASTPKTPFTAMYRGAVLIPNGIYPLDSELDLGLTPYVDLIGESWENTHLIRDGQDTHAVIWCRGNDCIIANMTIERTGMATGCPGLGTRFAVHSNTPGPKTQIFANLRCISQDDSQGMGIGAAYGDHILLSNVQSDRGFFLHNGDNRRENWENGRPLPEPGRPAMMKLLNCTSGGDPSGPWGIRYWNIGSFVRDRLTICGGRHHGSIYGLRVVDFGPPYQGDSETVVEIGGALFDGRAANVDVTGRTEVVQLEE